MNPKLKAYGFAPFTVLFFAVLLACTGGGIWYHFSRLRGDFTMVQGESFHLAEHVEEKMMALNETLHSLDVRPGPEFVADYGRQVAEMNMWLQTNRLSVTTAQQRNLLDRIQSAFDVYVRQATSLVEETMPAGATAKPKLVSQRVESAAAQVLGLARQLRAAEQVALNRFVKESRRSMTNLYLHVVLALGLAFVLGWATLRLIHVARIAPLKAQLDQSRAILERQEKLASLGTLAAGVAHEVRNPLACIKVRLHGLARVMREDPSANEDLSVIQDEIRRLERIVGDFLQFAHPSPPQVQTFAAAALFDQLKGLLAPQLEAASIRCQVEAPPEVCVRADPQQLKQVLINLIQNAVENTAPGGVINLRAATSPAHRPSEPAAGTLLEVADTGKGIAPSVARRMFDPFFSTKETGTGIGLSIAAGIVEKHGGSLRYQTAVGKGTTFTITLPGEADSKHES